MKLRVIASVILAAALSSQVYAIQITKGKLLSHKEWVTAGAKGSFQPGTKTKQSLKREGDDSDILPVMLSAYAHNATTTIGNSVSVQNDAVIAITNATDQQRSYSYSVTTCAESDVAGNTECVHYFNSVSLEPNGSFYDSISPVLDMTYNNPGVYQVYASTNYNGYDEAGSNITENGNSAATATITVS